MRGIKQLKFTRQLYNRQCLGRFVKRGAELWRFLLLPLVIFLFLLGIFCNIPGAVNTDYSASAATMFRSANYTGIMTRVSAGSDPDLVYADQALDNIIYPLFSLEPYQYENEIDWEVGGKSNTWYLYFQSLRVVGYLANAAEVSGDVLIDNN